VLKISDASCASVLDLNGMETPRGWRIGMGHDRSTDGGSGDDTDFTGVTMTDIWRGIRDAPISIFLAKL